MRLILLFAFCLALAANSVAAQSPASGAARRESVKPAAAAAIVNLNTANAAELQSLPGIGAKVAARIIEYREKKGRIHTFAASP